MQKLFFQNIKKKFFIKYKIQKFQRSKKVCFFLLKLVRNHTFIQRFKGKGETRLADTV